MRNNILQKTEKNISRVSDWDQSIPVETAVALDHLASAKVKDMKEATVRKNIKIISVMREIYHLHTTKVGIKKFINKICWNIGLFLC